MRPRLPVRTFMLCVAMLTIVPAQAPAALQVKEFTATTTTKPVDWATFLVHGSANFPPPGGFTPGDLSDDDPAAIPAQNAAGAHPALNLKIALCDPGPSSVISGCTEAEFRDDARDFGLTLAPGLLGNPETIPRCSDAAFMQGGRKLPPPADQCPANTRVGWTAAVATLKLPEGCVVAPPAAPADCLGGIRNTGVGYIYNLTPHGDEVARLGASVEAASGNADTFKIPSLITIVRDGSGQLRVRANTQLPMNATVNGQSGGFNGRGLKVEEIYISLFATKVGDASVPFMVNPTSCHAPAEFDTDFDSYRSPLTASASTSLQMSGCDAVPFDPAIEVANDDDAAGAPSGYDVSLTVPGDELPVRQSHLRRAEVRLPVGVGLSPGAAKHLAACTDAEFGLDNRERVDCPARSKIGDVEVETPYLDAVGSTPSLDTLGGSLYFGEPLPNDRWRLFMTIDDAGLLVKLRGSASIDETTGQITTVFDDLPQLPFTRFNLHLNGGDEAILTNPSGCGSHTTTADLTPWSSATETPKPVAGDFTTSACPAQRTFDPAFTATTSNAQAGADTDSRFSIEFGDRQQLMQGLNISLPAGLAGSLAAVPLCGADAARLGTCGEQSRIGSLATAAGSGGSPLRLPGELYLTEPLASGDVAGIAAVIPARVGPIDLGSVNVLSHVRLRPGDVGIDVRSEPIPHIFGGIPLRVRKIDIDVTREGFMVNPTGCDPRPFGAQISSYEGAAAARTAPFSAIGCDRLNFSPRLRLIAKARGQTSRFSHPGLQAIVTQPSGDANIRKAEVMLPQVLRPETVQFNKPGALCQADQLAVGACPPLSQAGTATAYSPLLPEPLSGPVHLVQHPGNPIPRLAVLLQGLASVHLDATNSIVGVRTLNVFDPVPDLPVTSFQLDIAGGSNGILKNFADLCGKPDHADATFTGQNGAAHVSKPMLEVEGCDRARATVTLARRVLKMSRKGLVPVRLRCSAACKGRLTLRTRSDGRLGSRGFALDRAGTARLSVRLNKRSRRVVNRRRALAAKAVLSVDGQTQRSTSITVKAVSRTRK